VAQKMFPSTQDERKKAAIKTNKKSSILRITLKNLRNCTA
jgi:hypothetical protein